jgi:hypothetical protein
VISHNVYYTLPYAPIENIAIHSRRSNDSGAPCDAVTSTVDVAPAVQFTLPDYTPPFFIEPEACYTPDPTVAALTPYGFGAMAFLLAFGAYVMKKRQFATVNID